MAELSAQEVAAVADFVAAFKGGLDQLPEGTDIETWKQEIILALGVEFAKPKQSGKDFAGNVCALANSLAALNGKPEIIKVTGDGTKLLTDAINGHNFDVFVDLVQFGRDIHSAFSEATPAPETPNTGSEGAE